MVFITYQTCWLSVLLLGTTLLFACASTRVPSLGSEQTTFAPEQDEKEIWEIAERLEHYLERKELIYKDAKLTDYFTNVMAKLLSQSLKNSRLQPRIRILENPVVNAISLPNGALYITTGLVAKIENEAQLATILGHELIHYMNRHVLQELRNQQNQQTAAAVVGLIFAVPTIGLSLQGSQVWAMAAVSGYSRELEAEADRSTLQLMVAANYDPREAPRVFENLLAIIKEEGSQEPYHFASHPKTQDRIDSNKELIRSHYADLINRGHLYVGTDEYLQNIKNLLLDNAVLDIEQGHFKSAHAAIDKYLTINPGNARAYYLLGNLHRKTASSDRDLEKALANYLRATRLPDTPAEVYREIGLLYRASGDHEKASVAFQRYLSIKPDAVDAAIIQSYR